VWSTPVFCAGSIERHTFASHSERGRVARPWCAVSRNAGVLSHGVIQLFVVVEDVAWFVTVSHDFVVAVCRLAVGSRSTFQKWLLELVWVEVIRGGLFEKSPSCL
jgi:hypothetical protein